MLFSCVSSIDRSKFVRLEQVADFKTEDFLNFSDVIENGCFKTKKPLIYSDLILPRQTILLEGLWNENYETLYVKAFDLFGNEYMTFDLDKKDVHIENRKIEALKNVENDFLNLVDVMQKIGAKGIRNFLCLGYLLPPKDLISKETYLEEKDRLSLDHEISGSYLTQTTMFFDNKKTHLINRFLLKKTAQKFDLIVRTRICDSPSERLCFGEIFWKGQIQDHKLTPQTFELSHFGFPKITLMFLDYE
jgi:hypothetical protein